MLIEKVQDAVRYTLSNEGLKTNDFVFPIARGRCLGGQDWILHDISFDEYTTGWPNDPHTIIDPEYSRFKPEEIKTSHGFGPREKYFKIIKREEQIIINPGDLFKRFEWKEIK